MTKITHVGLLLAAPRALAPHGHLHMVPQGERQALCGLATFLLTPGPVIGVGSDVDAFCFECLAEGIRRELVRVEVPHRPDGLQRDQPRPRSGRNKPPAWSIFPGETRKKRG